MTKTDDVDYLGKRISINDHLIKAQTSTGILQEKSLYGVIDWIKSSSRKKKIKRLHHSKTNIKIPNYYF